MQATARPAAVAAEREVADLYRAHFSYVWQVLQKLGVEHASLEDAAHDVFVVAHRRWGDFEGRSSARTWLFAVARRLAHRYRRADFRRRRRRAALALVPQPAVIEPDAALQRKEAWQTLLAFLDDLDPAHREAFLLGEVEGQSRAQMGRVLGISPNTAYSRLRTARRRFAESFPDPQQRQHVRRASAVPNRLVERRGRALLIAHFAASRTTILTGVLKAAGLVGVLTGVIAAASVVASPPHVDAGDRGGPAGDVASAVRPASDSASVAASATFPEAPVALPPQRPSQPQPTLQSSGVDVASEKSRRIGSRGSAPPRNAGGVEAAREPTTLSPAAEAGLATSSLADLDPAMVELVNARRALKGRRPDHALSLLERSRRLDIAGAFATERAITRVWALCASGRDHEAGSELRRLQRSGDAVAYASVLSGSCVADMINVPLRGDQEG